jgi:anti-sigma-K factor RskA
MLAASRTRQLPPRHSGETPEGWGRHAAARGRVLPGRLGSWLFRGPWLARGITGLAAVVVAVAVAMAVLAAGAQHRLREVQNSRNELEAVLGAPDVQLLTARVTSGGQAHVLESRHLRAFVFTAAGLRALPAAEGYELWLIGPAGTRSAGVLPRLTAGRTGPVVVSGLTRGDHLGMTVEPVAGAARPTSGPLLSLAG